MGERPKGYQYSFDDLTRKKAENEKKEEEKHEEGTTHVIKPNARIRVHTKSNHGFAWCTVIGKEFDAQEYALEEGERRRRSMHLFQALGEFQVSFLQHNGNTALYPPYTEFYAFPHPPDKTVKQLPGNGIAKK